MSTVNEAGSSGQSEAESEICHKSILIKTMKEKYGVEVGSLYMRPVNEEPVFKGEYLGICPVAAEKLKTQISLPVYPNMSLDDVDYVLECLEKAIKEQDQL